MALTDYQKTISEKVLSLTNELPPSEILENVESYRNAKIRSKKLNLTQHSLLNTLRAGMQLGTKITLLAGFNTWLKLKNPVVKDSKALHILAPATFIDTETDPAIREKNRIWLSQQRDRRKSTITFRETSAPVITTFDAPMKTDRPSTIIVTEWKPVSVFDYSQTRQAPLFDTGESKVHGNTVYVFFADNCPRDFEVIEEDNPLFNARLAGKTIYISRRKNEAAMTASLFHGIAKFLNANGNADKANEIDPKSEYIAEAVSHVVCGAYGIENDRSAQYIKTWEGDREKIKDAVTTITSLSQRIIDHYDRLM